MPFTELERPNEQTIRSNLSLMIEMMEPSWESACVDTRVVDGGVTATGVLSRERGNLITISSY